MLQKNLITNYLRSIIFSRRTILTIGIVSIIGVIISIIVQRNITEASAWYNDTYAYRQQYSFTHNADIPTERAITLSLDTAELITAGVMQADCDDARFTDGSGKQLKYQLTGVCNNAATTYEIVFPSINNGTNIGYVYYGNPSSTTSSQNVTNITTLTPSGGDPTITTRTIEEKGTSPVLYYSFDEGYGTTVQDSTSNNNDGTLGGTIGGGPNGGPVKIDDAGDPGQLLDMGRQVVRTSTGTLYAFQNDGGSCEIWKSSDGSSWTEQDSANNPACSTASSGSVASAIDSSNGLHLIYSATAATKDVYYVPFSTTTDTFGTPELAISNATSGFVYGMSITIDSNNNPHVAAGGEYTFGLSLRYRMRLSGAWQTQRTVESLANFSNGPKFPDITINEDNIPEISYINTNDADLTVAVGNANNPTSFTLQDIDADVPTSSDASISVDSSGNTWVAYLDENGATDYITLVKHNDADAWSTWQSAITNSNAGIEPAVSISGGTIYVFYQDDNADIVYDSYNGTSWLGETVLQAGTFQDVKPRWSFLNNYSYSSGLDYLYSDGTDVSWASLALSTITGVPTIQSETLCVAGSCLSYDGSDDNIVTSNADPIDLDRHLAGEFSISTWIRANSDGENDVGEVFQKGTNTYIRVDTQGADNKVDLQASVDLGTTDATLNIADIITLNQWHHITITYKDDADDEITVYVDGKQSGTSTDGSGAPASDSNPLLIGGGTTANFHGFIDEFKIYAKELTEAQVRANFNAKSNFEGAGVTLGYDSERYLSDGLVGYWNMDEGTGTTISNESGLSTTGTLVNGPTWKHGKFGSSTDYDGTDDYTSITNSEAFDVGQNVSVAAWVNIEGGAGSIRHILSRPSGSDWNNRAEYTLRVNTTNRFQFLVGQDEFTTAEGTTTVTSSTWYHVVGTYNGQLLRVYVNGILEAEVDQNVTLADSLQDVALGTRHVNSPGEYFNGLIDEARVYNRALSPAEVQQLYTWAPGPVGYWKLDEKTGSTAYDSSGNGINGILTNSPSYITGKYGSALFMPPGSSDTGVSIAHNALLDVTDNENFTLEGWIYYISTESGNNGSIIGKFNCCGDGEYRLYVDSVASPTLGLDIVDNAAAGNDTYNISTTSTIATNTWMHVAATFDGADANNSNIFINGIKQSVTRTGTLSNIGSLADANNFFIGQKYYNFIGSIDDAKMYKYVRTPSQIIQDMNAGHPLVGTPIAAPVAHWKFDEGYGTTANDSTPNNNDLTFNTASWTNSGKYGKAWNGTGSTWLTRADDPDFDFAASDEFTLSTWIKSDSATNPSFTENIIDKGDAGPAYAIRIDSSGQLEFAIDDDASGFPEDQAITTGTDYYDNQWHHVVAVKTGTSRIDLYVDGKLIDSDTSLSATGTLANSDFLNIGDQDATNGTDEFNGDIDEVKVYRVALTAADVQAEYNSGKTLVLGSTSTSSDGISTSNSALREYCVPGSTTSCDPPIAEWKFDENSGITANDSSGNGRSGTLNGSASWRPGKYGKGIYFDGSGDYISYSAMPITSNLTIAGWFTLDQLDSAGGQLLTINTGTIGIYHNIAAENALIGQYHRGSGFYNKTTTTLNYTSGTSWHHFAYSIDSTNNSQILYIDGNPRGVSTHAQDLVDNGGVASYVGNSGAVDTGFEWKGMADQFKLFSYAMSPAQVAWDYNKGKPTAHWQFDETTGIVAYDKSGNNLTGTLTNSPVRTTSGKFNSALNFDGIDDYVTVTNASAIDGNEALQNGLSVAGWIYADTDGESDIGQFFSKGTETFCRTDSQSGNNLDIQCELDLATDATLNIASAITTSAWNHVTIVWENDADDEISIYINGVNKGTSTDGVGPYSTDTSNFLIGNNSATTNSYDGLLDDFRIYNYPLTSEQIKLIMNDSSSVRF